MTTKSQKIEKKYREEEKKKRIKEFSIRWDKKSIVVLVSIFCFIAILYFVVTEDIKGYFVQRSQNWAVGIGQVQSIDKITGISQTLVGNRIETKGFKIKYNYLVDGVGYEHEYIIRPTQKNVWEFINFVEPLDSIEIYYKKEDPEKSYINFNIDSDFYKKEKSKR